jgi:hypothetical protein
LRRQRQSWIQAERVRAKLPVNVECASARAAGWCGARLARTGLRTASRPLGPRTSACAAPARLRSRTVGP